eukprot:3691025-Amphidinium_carterae.1
MRTQDCRQLKTKKHKKRPIGFTAGTEEASSSGITRAGEATGGLFLLASTAQSGNRLTAAATRFTAPVESSGTGSTDAATNRRGRKSSFSDFQEETARARLR